jgi:Tol biopolymer transport system component
VTARRTLTATEPDGTVHWSLAARERVADPAWAPSGIRVAYRAGDSLRVVAGDGTGDRRLVRHVAPTPPAWAPSAKRNVLAFVGSDGAVRAVDVESGRTLWRSPPIIGGVRTLQWSKSGRLLVGARSFFVILDRRGQAVAKGTTGGSAEAMTLAPDGGSVAVAHRTNTGSELTLMRPSAGRPSSERRLFAGPGRFDDLAWSPDGEWLLMGWRDADQWLFIRPADRKVVAVSGISRQFAPGASGPVGFPQVDGWCCGMPRR